VLLPPPPSVTHPARRVSFAQGQQGKCVLDTHIIPLTQLLSEMLGVVISMMMMKVLSLKSIRDSVIQTTECIPWKLGDP
jgi:hypothetical protein